MTIASARVAMSSKDRYAEAVSALRLVAEVLQVDLGTSPQATDKLFEAVEALAPANAAASPDAGLLRRRSALRRKHRSMSRPECLLGGVRSEAFACLGACLLVFDRSAECVRDPRASARNAVASVMRGLRREWGPLPGSCPSDAPLSGGPARWSL